jgi:arsenate reductase (thioredoxin)
MVAIQHSQGKKRVLFVCRHNAARSQMAEAILRTRGGDRYEAYSAGTEPSAVHPMTIRVLQEIGIDCSGYRAKSIEELTNVSFDLIVTLCDQARESCPYVPGAAVMHRDFDNPVDAVGTDEEVIKVFRKVREEISQWIEKEFA